MWQKIPSFCFPLLLMFCCALLPCACAKGSARGPKPGTAVIIARAENEGELDTLGMPDAWANYKGIWDDLRVFYSLRQSDTDLGSAQIADAFEKGLGDIADVGCEYGKMAEARHLTLKYKTPYWDEIPAWAKDQDGDWIIAYTGTLAFAANVSITAAAPRNWRDILGADYRVALNSPITDTIGQYSVYAAALAMGGSADNIEPGIVFFKTLAEQNRLVSDCITLEDFLNSGAAVQPLWDFTALSYRDRLAARSLPVHLSICIPGDASVTVGYATIINSRARHPYAAMAAREYILSDAGQLNLAEGYATPIRPVSLPEELEKKRIPPSQYSRAMTASALTYKPETARAIAAAWKREVLPLLEGGPRP